MNELMNDFLATDFVPVKKYSVEKIENTSYTIIYRDTDGQLKEAWHHLNDTNIPYVSEKYRKAGKLIHEFRTKTLPFGQYLSTIVGGSK